MRIQNQDDQGRKPRACTKALTLVASLALLASAAFGADLGKRPGKTTDGIGNQPSKSLEIITNSIGMKLVLLPPGEFSMGADEPITDTLGAYPYVNGAALEDEVPRHKAQIANAFYMGQHEVTLGQFLKFYHAAGYKTQIERNTEPSWGYKNGRLVESNEFRPWAPGWEIGFDHPAIFISWNDAAAFCNWLSEKEGLKYRLPTEAEWEYACRAGSNTRYSFGNDPEELVKHANAADQDRKTVAPKAIIDLPKVNGKELRIPFPYLSKRDGYAWTAPVGRFQPNAFGLYDMHGNAWEWCLDSYDPHAYEKMAEGGSPTGTNRVIRGGAFNYHPFTLRSADRNNDNPAHCDCSHGFRVVCERQPSERSPLASGE